MNFKKIFIFIITFILFFNISLYAKKKKTIQHITRNPILQKYQEDNKVQEIISVSLVEETSAILKMYVRDEEDISGWKLILATDAFIGQKGLGKQKEGDLKTPTGEFNITQAFGIKDNPGTKLKYIKATDTIYACDEDCKYYNQIIDTNKTKHQCEGEHLLRFKPEYNYGLCIDYNKENIYPNGSNIFINVKGNNVYSTGSIEVDEDSMIILIQNATTRTKVIIN